MPKKFHKSLQEYLSKIKKQTPHLQIPHSSISSMSSKIFSGCKYPKKFSFHGEKKGDKRKDQDEDHKDQDHHGNADNAATLEDIDRFLLENFRSLYGENQDTDKHQDIDNYELAPSTPPDLSGSYRFHLSPSSFFEEEAGGSTPTSTGGSSSLAIPKGVEDCIAVLTVSPSPQEEFKRSMKEVIEARINNNQRVDWDFMEEVLFCFLRLNEKKQYRFILSAFVDLIVTLRQSSIIRNSEAVDRENKHCNSPSNKGKERLD